MSKARISANAFRAGRDAMLNGDFEMALTAFRWARRADSGNPVYIHAEAVLARKMHNYHESENLYRRVIDVAARAFGPSDPRTATIALGLVELYEEMGRHDEARGLSIHIVDNLDRQAAAMGSVRSLNRIAEICHRADRPEDAMRIHWRAVAYRRKVFGHGHAKVGELRAGIAALRKRASSARAARPVADAIAPLSPALLMRQPRDTGAAMVI